VYVYLHSLVDNFTYETTNKEYCIAKQKVDFSAKIYLQRFSKICCKCCVLPSRVQFYSLH